MGAEVKKFEGKMANYFGVKHFVMVNSGSSAKIASVIEKIADLEQIGGIINICSGVGKSIAEAGHEMLMTAGFSTPWESFLPGNSDMPYIVGSNSKLLRMIPGLDLEWKPSVRPF